MVSSRVVELVYICTVKSVLKDHSIGHEIWFLWWLVNCIEILDLPPGSDMWSCKTGGLSWQWPLKTGVTVCLKWHRVFGLELSPVITWPTTLDIFVPAHKYMYYYWYYHCDKEKEARTVKAINMKLLIKRTQSKQMLKRFLTAVKVQSNRYCETYMWSVLLVPVLKTALIQVWIPTIGHSQSKDSDFSQSQASCFYSNFSQ